MYLRIAFDGDYGINGTGMPRHNLKTGPQIPVTVMQELDRKVDDGKPYRGTLQFSAYAGNAVAPQESGAEGCTTASDIDASWSMQTGSANCGAALML